MAHHIEPPAGTLVQLSDVPFGEWYPFFMQWQVPIGVSVLYTVLAFYFNPSKGGLSRMEAKRLNIKLNGAPPSKSLLSPMTMVVFAHNAVLAAYSAWAFRSVFPLFISNIATKGWRNGLCDIDGHVWNTALFMHSYLFYLSKYYELIDTVIVILKGRKATLLQIYHHAGVIVVMYYACYYSPASCVFIVWENAGVHAVMYTYYMLTALGFNPPGKQYLTSLQIFQFLFGQSFIVVYLLLPSCQSASQRMWLWILTSYLLPLIYMFVQFFTQTYKKDDKAKKAQ
ncbi:hypothetical protein GGI04_003842 [Coemansia thaxteri]|uniref:Elongation of fatty acids protein n=1 Tax=Coemansia thaxteri TaxID=2663907 RepID=A0A9W8BDB1_9FUNG|nr:hypothetical protein GGI04_003842 [Coemansia thaxteri]KAJ2001464.1 hypothetical protein H4R26_004118 [Coemansia thaxteri]KAJ2470940.1 hypothetical protein GGI02_002593 [Coemansia sp. RSA 2322]